jgi:NAD(P)-dependent dehydrogenase (short-subunit alcohol dehydrogenase family)
MATPLLDWLLVKKWGLAPAIPCKTKNFRCLAGACPIFFSMNARRSSCWPGCPGAPGFGLPDEFGALACFLASAAVSYITGADPALDGGGSAG